MATIITFYIPTWEKQSRELIQRPRFVNKKRLSDFWEGVRSI